MSWRPSFVRLAQGSIGAGIDITSAAAGIPIGVKDARRVNLVKHDVEPAACHPLDGAACCVGRPHCAERIGPVCEQNT